MLLADDDDGDDGDDDDGDSDDDHYHDGEDDHDGYDNIARLTSGK